MELSEGVKKLRDNLADKASSTYQRVHKTSSTYRKFHAGYIEGFDKGYQQALMDVVDGKTSHWCDCSECLKAKEMLPKS